MARPPYPPIDPQPILLAVEIIREGTIAERQAELAKATWEILGMVAGMTWGEPVSPIGSPMLCSPAATAAFAELQALYLSEQSAMDLPQTGAEAIPWLTLIQWLIQILLSLKS